MKSAVYEFRPANQKKLSNVEIVVCDSTAGVARREQHGRWED